MIKTFAIRSGSSGNAVYVGDENAGLLIDAGVSVKGLLAALAEHDVSPSALRGVVITHEHSDHVSGLGPLLRRLGLPLFISPLTFERLRRRVGVFDSDLVRPIEALMPFTVGGFHVMGVATSHDAVDPMAFRVEGQGGTVILCTDTGVLTDAMQAALGRADVVYLEANYDEMMLWNGTYTLAQKRRIHSAKGHLSNEDAGQAMATWLTSGAHTIVLSHLSQNNNVPHLALEAVMDHARALGAVRDRDYHLSVAKRYQVSPAITF